MLTWMIVKARIDSSLNLYEHCVACDDENNCPAGPALRGKPCGAAYPAYHASTCAVHRCTPQNTSKSGVQPAFVSKDGQRQCARRLFASINVPQRQNKRFWGYFGDILAVPRFRPILAYFEAIFGLHLAARGPTGQLWAPKWGPPLRADHLSWTMSVGVQFSGGGLIHYN